MAYFELANPCFPAPQGWRGYLADEPSSFADLTLVWENSSVVPAWLTGSYIKNGPARRHFGDRKFSSYLDGQGKLHK